MRLKIHQENVAGKVSTAYHQFPFHCSSSPCRHSLIHSPKYRDHCRAESLYCIPSKLALRWSAPGHRHHGETCQHDQEGDQERPSAPASIRHAPSHAADDRSDGTGQRHDPSQDHLMAARGYRVHGRSLVTAEVAVPLSPRRHRKIYSTKAIESCALVVRIHQCEVTGGCPHDPGEWSADRWTTRDSPAAGLLGMATLKNSEGSGRSSRIRSQSSGWRSRSCR